MVFNEAGAVEVPKYPDSFVYFLVNGDEVVYVGQTKHGISRPLSHVGCKEFDHIFIIECAVADLDFVEGNYIAKYQPKYNKTIGTATHYSLLRARNVVREKCGCEWYTVRDIRNDCEDFNMRLVVIDGTAYVSNDDLTKIISMRGGNTCGFV